MLILFRVNPGSKDGIMFYEIKDFGGWSNGLGSWWDIFYDNTDYCDSEVEAYCYYY